MPLPRLRSIGSLLVVLLIFAGAYLIAVSRASLAVVKAALAVVSASYISFSFALPISVSP